MDGENNGKPLLKVDDLGATKRWIQMDAESSWDRPAVALEFTPFDQGLGDDVFDQEIWRHLRVLVGCDPLSPLRKKGNKERNSGEIIKPTPGGLCYGMFRLQKGMNNNKYPHT